MCLSGSRDRIVVSTLRCGRNNPGSNPGHGTFLFFLLFFFLEEISCFVFCLKF